MKIKTTFPEVFKTENTNRIQILPEIPITSPVNGRTKSLNSHFRESVNFQKCVVYFRVEVE